MSGHNYEADYAADPTAFHGDEDQGVISGMSTMDVGEEGEEVSTTVEMVDGGPSARSGSAGQQMIIVKAAKDQAQGPIVIRGGTQILRMGGVSSSLPVSRTSPMKVQVIGGQNLRRADVPGTSKTMIIPSSTQGGQPVLIRPSGSQSLERGSLIAASGKGGGKVQYYRVMPAADVKPGTQQFRHVVPTPQPQGPKPPSFAQAKQTAEEFYTGPTPPEPAPPPPARPSGRKKSVLPSGNRKPCNCTKSMCLKLYCDCFANGEFCRDCNCKECHNNLEHEGERTKAIKSSLERNPHAFQPKIGKGRSEIDRMHQKGCHCKKSSCLKNYCECYEAKVPCSARCKCCGCRNTEQDREAKGKSGRAAGSCGLLGLASAAASSDLRSDSPYTDSDEPSKTDPKSMPWFYMTDEVVECTTLCLMAQAEELEKAGRLSDSEMERRVLREFGRCLKEIIHNAALSNAQPPPS